MTIEQFLILALIQTILSAVAAILCFVKYKSRSLVSRLMGFIFLAGTLANISSWLLVQLRPSKPLTNIPPIIYSMLSTWLFSWMYFSLVHERKRTWFIMGTVLFVIFSLVNVFFIQKINIINSYSYLFQSVLLIIYSLYYFYFLMQDLPSLYIYQLPAFWFNAGLLFYHAGTFFLFSFADYLVNVLNNDLISYWGFHNVVSILAHFTFFVGIYYDLKSLKFSKIAP